METMNTGSWILFMSTYPPRECGIATFTRDLSNAIGRKFPDSFKPKILAINNDVTRICNYPEEVIYHLNDSEEREYSEIARQINANDNIKLVNIQHEFGIFGGEYGSMLLEFLGALKKPSVVTFHTVLPEPNDKLKTAVKAIAKKVKSIIVMSKTAVKILRKDYGIRKSIHIIPHGIPDVPFNFKNNQKAELGFRNKNLILSFGMMDPGKGYEYVIDALPKAIKKFPNLVYLIIGQTHPVVRKRDGESYRRFLDGKVISLGLQKHVRFYNKYLELGEILKYLEATDIYISSNLGPNQIVSGTLSYAMGCGKPVISTPYLYAKDIVNGERGALVDFRNPELFSDAIIRLFSNPGLREEYAENSYSFTRHMTWENVASEYCGVFRKYTKSEKNGGKFPRVTLKHLNSLSDDFGVIQFAEKTIPEVPSGYTLDDNARALIVCCMHYDFFKEENDLRLIKLYIDFIKYVCGERRIYNLVDSERKIDTAVYSEDAHGRAVWALGYMASLDSIPAEFRKDAAEIFLKSIGNTEKISSPRAVSFMIAGLYFYNLANPSEWNILKIRNFSDYLVMLYKNSSDKNWRWFEKYMTYSNSKISEALLYGYLATKNEEYLKIAKSSLDFLMSVTFNNGTFAPVGQDGWYVKDSRKADFDQQPVDASCTVQTMMLAYKIFNEPIYLEKARVAFQWFLGSNHLKQPVYDSKSGGCHDGLGKNSVNFNQGAESTISYLLARLTMETSKS